MIPTFRRFDLLCEAVASAIVQRCSSGPVEIVVVDNDPQSTNAERLLERMPAIRDIAFRYYINAENLGMFGNWNRCIELGRGEWHSMLHDDDLLDPDFADVLMSTIAWRPKIDGIACRKRNLDQRAQGKPPPPGAAQKALRLARDMTNFGFSDYRIVDARKLFWASTLGNPTGFICRKSAAIDAGGYRQEDYPSGDHFFFARFAARFRLAQHKQVLASFRMAVNETMGPDVIRGFVVAGWNLQQQMAGRDVPRWWARLSGLSAACEIAAWNRYWHTDVDACDVERAIGQALPKPRRRLYLLGKVLLGGF